MIPDPKQDGVDHINIYSGGKTVIGRWMSNFANEPVYLDGKVFASIEGYWYWLACHDDRLPKMHGYDAKKLGKQLCGYRAQIMSETPEFQEKIQIALRKKCEKRPDMVAAIMESNLPLTHYYVMNGRVVLAGFGWLINFWKGVQNGS